MPCALVYGTLCATRITKRVAIKHPSYVNRKEIYQTHAPKTKEHLTVEKSVREREREVLGTANCKWKLIVLLAESDANQMPS